MKSSVKKGFSFGLTSGIITTLGLIVGLHSTSGSRKIVIGGILVIAIADALSDALGIHMSEEAENVHTEKEIWEATLMTFLTKFFMAMTFIIPVIIFSLSTAIIISIIWGLSLITIFSYRMAKAQNSHKLKVVFEHLIIAGFVIFVTHYIGDWIATFN